MTGTTSHEKMTKNPRRSDGPAMLEVGMRSEKIISEKRRGYHSAQNACASTLDSQGAGKQGGNSEPYDPKQKPK
jgi:hypothetical protein